MYSALMHIVFMLDASHICHEKFLKTCLVIDKNVLRIYHIFYQFFPIFLELKSNFVEARRYIIMVSKYFIWIPLVSFYLQDFFGNAQKLRDILFHGLLETLLEYFPDFFN